MDRIQKLFKLFF